MVSRPSFPFGCTIRELITGERVMATMPESTTAAARVMANSRKSEPVSPPWNASGVYTAARVMVIAMTITLAAVYTPLAFQGGLTGSLFLEFAITLAAAVVLSGIVAITLSPVMSSRMVHPKGKEGRLTILVNR